MKKTLFLLAASLSFMAGFTHFAIIIGGGDWYRFFGAGEQMAIWAEQGDLYPHLITAGIALILITWGCYALSGAKIIRRLPLLRTALITISAIYLFRGIGGLFAAFVPAILHGQELSQLFLIVSSVICLSFGLVYSFSIYYSWDDLSKP